MKKQTGMLDLLLCIRWNYLKRSDIFLMAISHAKKMEIRYFLCSCFSIVGSYRGMIGGC